MSDFIMLIGFFIFIITFVIIDVKGRKPMKMNNPTDQFLYDTMINRYLISDDMFEYYSYHKHFLGSVVKYGNKYATTFNMHKTIESHPFDFIYESEIDAIKALIAQKGR